MAPLFLELFPNLKNPFELLKLLLYCGLSNLGREYKYGLRTRGSPLMRQSACFPVLVA